MSDEVEPSDEKSLFIFGRDISKIPCFRNSLLYGIGGGLASGLGHFLFSSRPIAAANFAVYTFCGITVIYWTQCRYKYAKTKFELMRIQELMRTTALYEGTEQADKKRSDILTSEDGLKTV